MKPCDERWRGELFDHTLGSPASRALTAHLEHCAVCSEALREWKARVEKIDDGVRQLVTSEPSAQAALRVMAELRARRRRVWLPEWRTVSATLAGLSVVIASFIYIRKAAEQRKETDKTLSAASAIGSWRSPTEGLLRFPADQWLNAPPQLGTYFYPLDTDVPEKERKNP
jgi:hypothetical protein